MHDLKVKIKFGIKILNAKNTHTTTTTHAMRTRTISERIYGRMNIEGVNCKGFVLEYLKLNITMRDYTYIRERDERDEYGYNRNRIISIT
jgi:hypothetical protein